MIRRGNTLKKGMVMITIGDHTKTKDPLIEEDTLMEVRNPLIEEDSLMEVEDSLLRRGYPGGGPLMEMVGPLEEGTLVEDPLMEE